MVGDGSHQPESRREGAVHVRFGREDQDGAVFGEPEQRRDQPVEGALEGAVQGLTGGDGVDDGARDGRPGHAGEEGHGEDGRPGRRHQQRGAEADAGGTRHEGGERAVVREVRQCLRRPVRALRPARQRAQHPPGRGVRRREGAAGEQDVEGDARGRDGGEDRDHRPALADREHDHAPYPHRPADAVQLVGERRGGAGVGGGVVVRLVEGEVDDVPAGLQDHGAESERPYVVTAAAPGRSQREARVVGVLLGAVEGGVEPGAERGVLQGVAGELAVGAVQDERADQQDPGRDEADAGAGGRAARRDQRGEQGGGGDLVRGQAPAGAPAGQVARVRADAERGEEAVAGLHGRLQAYGLVADVRHGLPCLVAGLRVGRDLGDQAAQLGAVDAGAVGVEGGDHAVGEAVHGDRRTAARGVVAGHRAGQGLAAGRLGRDGARDRGEREAGVGETEAQCVQVAHEAGVDHGDPLVARNLGEERLGIGGVGGDPYVEAEGPQITLDRRSGDRLTGEDGGRQPNSLPGCRRAGAGHVHGGGAPLAAPVGRHVGRGYRMPGGCRSPPVHGPINAASTGLCRDHHRLFGVPPTNRGAHIRHPGH